ncbi:MAG: 30S ribosomal protein S1 [Flavobacteriaceae bacterium]|nr:30S ribosomal protein S1 [Flavobacteriaceae bacterium]
MTKTEEKIELYIAEMNKLGLSFEKDLFTKVTKGLGPSLFRKDAEVVSCSDDSELATVKKNFLIKKHGLEDTEKLDTVIMSVCEKMGKSNKNKYRAIFYYLLVQDLDLGVNYDEDTKISSKEEVVVKKETKEISELKETPVDSATEIIEEVTELVDKKVTEVNEEEPKVDPAQFLADFNWHKYEEGIELIDAEKIRAFDKALEGIEGFVEERQVIDGTVMRMTDREAIIDINSKSEGVISLNEFRYNSNLAVGDKVEVLVDKLEDATGQLVLSHRKARVIKAWERVNDAHTSGEIVTGHVKCRTKGGMIVDVFGIEAFLPGSQIDVKPIRDYDQFVDKNMEFKVVKVNHEFKNVVVSHKALIEADIASQKKEIIGQLEKGQVLEGIVKNVTSYGVFVDLGGVDGLIHITDLSWSRINHPNEIVELDQTLNVVILDFDEGKTRIQLGLKQLSKHPWEALDGDLKVGDKVEGSITIIADYGAFIEVAPGVEGLIHVSEMSWSTHLRSAQDFVKVGDKIEAEVLSLDREDRKMSLGIKQLHVDPWTDITKKYPVGSKHVGTVRNYTNFGVFVELEEGIDGLVYISDLSWTKKVKHPSDFVSVGDKLDVVVLELNVEDRKLNIGHKQTQENPWDAIESTYTIDSIHSGTVTEKNDKGSIVNFEKDVDGFVPLRHMEKEDGSKLVKGDTVDFKILEFNKEYRRLVVSHTAIFKEQETKNIKTAQKKQESAEKITIGEANTALADLKKKMEGK